MITERKTMTLSPLSSVSINYPTPVELPRDTKYYMAHNRSRELTVIYQKKKIAAFINKRLPY